MKLFLSIILGLGLVASMRSQNINDYSYVKVPEKFEFLKAENQFQLNALTAFLFKKHGFRVLFRDKAPLNVDPCEVLTANVLDDSGLLRSKLYITLENCNNEVVFTSKTGTSREKDFKTSFHEALREAFISVKELNYSPEGSVNEVVVDPAIPLNRVDKENLKSREVSSEENKEIEVISKSPETKTAKEPTFENVKNNRFINGSITYILKPTKNGFDLYQEGSEEEFGRLLKSGGGDNYLYSSKNISGNAFFDTRGNLIVEYLDPINGQLITVNYNLEAQ